MSFSNGAASPTFSFFVLDGAHGARSGSFVMIYRRNGVGWLHFVAQVDKIAENCRRHAMAQHLLKPIGERGSHRVGSVQEKLIKKRTFKYRRLKL